MSYTVIAVPFKRKPISHLLLLGTLCVGIPAGMLPSSVMASSMQEASTSRHWNISAGPLGQALNTLGQQSGILLSYSTDLVEGKFSAGLSGHYTVQEALDLLLSSTGLQSSPIMSGGFLIRARGQTDTDQTVLLPLMRVEGGYARSGFSSLESGEMRNAMRGDLAESLSIIPSVRVADRSSSSLQQGDIKPAEFSIRGAAPYQNKLMLDGAAIDNLMDPAQREGVGNYTSVAGHSQSIFINSDFLQHVEVIDVNASASEGGFTGGVIKAETKAYQGEDSFSISRRMTRDSWTTFHVDPVQQGTFGDAAAQLPVGLPGEFQPNFRKDQTSIQGATRLGDIGVFAGLDLNVSAGLSSDERYFEKNIMDQYKNTTVYDGGMIGGYGELENEQHTLNTTLKFSSPLADTLSFDYGGELRWTHFRQNRLNDFIFNEYRLDFTQPLPPQIGLGSWSPADQFKYRQVIYQAGKTQFSNLNSAAFAELHSDQQRIFWRTGLRLERDAWLGNTNVAPRLSGGIYLDDDKRYRLSAGANRYYGKSFLAYRLREKERDLIVETSRTSPTGEFMPVDLSRRWLYQDLDTPYDDEINLGISGPVLSGEAGLVMVERRGERQVRTQQDTAKDLKWFDNSGSSRTHQIDLYWRSTPAEWLGAYWAVNTSASWMDKQTDTTYGNDSSGYLSSINGDEEVWFDGKRILKRDLPASNFATPVSVNLDLITRSPNDRIQLRNAFAFTNGYRYLRNLGRDTATGLSRYDVYKQGSTLRWDMSLDFRLLESKNSPYLRVDVVNVTDNQNVVSAESNVQLFGVGRQYWLELGYRF
ncbi:TonB-dependent receptor [Nitrincola nitratireducens]|uniref:Outer membrane receptor for ferric coprogen and ferric-rhodotorulic acid n=1 Tax=Nitrincola nitratireducens TaxID=1229521 RepID=W9VI30_9GAMM|nr:secretin and TonB N-terminal domain-containing protein [Nitrincola nitratireducens]EXJ10260.1 Outer membrane receptor for ferric coprogen and ferric-rhodotorulic acid [Nitrincola nitratireducens]